VEINSGGSGVIYKSECECCKSTKALKRLRDGTQNKNFDNE
ncbi:18312_t:CDS:2, partial [Racocetra persica]